MDAPHTVRQNIPLSKAIDRTNIKEFHSSVPLAPQYVKAHPLDLETPDPLLTPVVTSTFQSLQLPGRETTHIQTHAHEHPYTHTGHICAQTRVHRYSNTETDYRWVQGSPDDLEGT